MNFFYNVYAEASSVESLEVYLQDHSDELYDIYASRYNVLSCLKPLMILTNLYN